MRNSITAQNQSTIFRASNPNQTHSSQKSYQLIERSRDKAWSVVQYFRLYRMYGDEYLPILDQLVREIQALQDEATDVEKSLAEEAELERSSEPTSHMGPA